MLILLISAVSLQGYHNLRSWKVHWDRQIYKALEISYVSALEVINDRIPTVPIELLYR